MSEIFNYQKLYRAYLDCRKNKRGTVNAIKFELDLERNLFQLLKELTAKTYVPGRSICFVVENPTIREIFAADFRDRIVHHLLVNELIKIGESLFSFESFACRKEKGTHRAIGRLKAHIRSATENFRHDVWYMQLDVAGFFMSIDHRILYDILEKEVNKQNKSFQWKEDILWLIKQIIFHKPTDNYVKKGNPELFKLVPARKSLFHSSLNKGLPIGNYSSQFFANFYMNELDQFIKRELGIEHYVRYVDDFILIHEYKNELKRLKKEIETFLEEKLDLKLHNEKTKLQSVKTGIDFLGYFIKPNYVLVRRRVVKKMKEKLHDAARLPMHSSDLPSILATVNSYLGHFRHSASFNLRNNICKNHLGNLKEKFILPDNCLLVKLAGKV